MKFTLSSPVTHGEITYTELTFREAETGDLMAADKFEGQTSKIVAILASMSEVPLPAFRKIKARDLTKIMAATAELMGESEPATTGA
jgi:phage FluMu protein gp41